MNYCKPLIPRFWSHVDKSQGECWIWTKAKSKRGYGVIQIKYKSVRCHRFSWEIHNGPIPEGLLVCHKCDNPACVRPDHLFLGTHKDNMRDMSAKGRAASGDRNFMRKCPELVLRGESHPLSPFTDEDVIAIRKLYLSGAASQVAIANLYGVTHRAIGRIVKGQTWKHIPMPQSFDNHSPAQLPPS